MSRQENTGAEERMGGIIVEGVTPIVLKLEELIEILKKYEAVRDRIQEVLDRLPPKIPPVPPL